MTSLGGFGENHFLNATLMTKFRDIANHGAELILVQYEKRVGSWY